MRRRAFFRGIGGAALAAPFLSSLDSPARARAGGPRRLVIFQTSAGCLTNRWFPSVEHGSIDPSSMDGTTLEVLGPHAHKLLFPRGLAMFPRGQVAVGGASYFDPHDQGMGSKLTAAPIDPEGAHWALGRSLDHVAAELVNPAGNGPLVLSVGKPFVNVKGIISYAGAREPQAPETDPAVVYDSLTRVPGRRGGTRQTMLRAVRKQSLIDLVRADVDSLRRLDMSGGDQHKLSDWLDLFRDTERQIACNVSSFGSLGVTEEDISEVSASAEDTALAFTIGGDIMIKLIALTLMCDVNRSVVLQWPGYVTFDWDGIHHRYDHQGLSHRNGGAVVGGPCIDGVLDMIGEIDHWYAGRYAQLVTLLDSISEGDGTVLDNSAVVWIPELADGNAHNNNNLPVVIAGSAGGYLRQGVSVNLEGQPLGAGESSAYCVTPGDFIGSNTGSSGGNVPLNKLYVTLLNALGALDDEGAPITEFGQVDSNDIEAGITDPGELDALKA